MSFCGSIFPSNIDLISPTVDLLFMCSGNEEGRVRIRFKSRVSLSLVRKEYTKSFIYLFRLRIENIFQSMLTKLMNECTVKDKS